MRCQYWRFVALRARYTHLHVGRRLNLLARTLIDRTQRRRQSDDGIEAPGFDVLQQIASEISDDVWIVAPETDQSGAAHSLTLHEPLRLRQTGERTYAVRGTPTDCVIMGVRHILDDKRPDLVLSGVNRGANIAEDVTYSGTIAAAFEAALLGIRAIALSQAFGIESKAPRWETAIAHAPDLLRRLIGETWGPDVLLNVNFPDRAPDAVAGTLITRQGRRELELLSIDERRDTWGDPYYWLAYERKRSTTAAEGTDLWAIYQGYVSVTPLSLDLTHSQTHVALKTRFGS